MNRALTIVSAFVLTLVCHGQTVLRWQNGDPTMTREFVDGKLIQSITANGLVVSVSLSDTPKATVAEVFVFNGSERSRTVLPQEVRLSIVQPKEKELYPKEPSKIIGSIQRRARIQSALDEMGASMQQQQATTASNSQGNVQLADNRGTTVQGTYNSSTVATTTAPDWQARRAAASRTIARAGNAQNAAEFISSSALKANTVHAGKDVSGLIWFDKDSLLKKKGVRLILRVPIDDVVFEFPFGK